MRQGYSEKYSLDWRVDSANKVINDAIKNLNVDKSIIIVWGHSEGSQGAPTMAVKNKKVTHVISMNGNSLSHLYDFILAERISVMNGEITNREAQSKIDLVFFELEKIYQNPESTSKAWF